jgi:hypothetical protein
MKSTPRRRRVRVKLWLYLALFGADEDSDDTTADSDDTTADSTTDPTARRPVRVTRARGETSRE